jgi:hypothetical protein
MLVQRRSRKDQVKQQILNGRYTPGQRLREVASDEDEAISRSGLQSDLNQRIMTTPIIKLCPKLIIANPERIDLPSKAAG